MRKRISFNQDYAGETNRSALSLFLFSSLLFYLVVLPQVSWAQQAGVDEAVSGTVLDASSDQTLPGVNIIVKGTSIGTSSGANGDYEFIVPSLKDTLIVSFVGYQSQEVPINGRTSIDIRLKTQAISGEELVVVGYSEKQRGEITGSVTNIQGENLTKAPVNNITQSIQGKIAGVIVNDRGGEPGDNNAEFLIRGQATLGNNAPLIVIDGVPREEESFANLSPNDIENISVLKDASAAIYGSRAANGVILVTTKKGQAGKPTITLNSSYGVETITKYPEAMTSYQRAKYFNEFYEYNGQQPLWSEEALQHFRDGDQPLEYPNTNWSDLVVADNAPKMHHNIAAEGGAENIQYYLSLDYLNQQGLYKSGDLSYKQYQVRARLNSQVTDNLDIGLNLEGRKGDRHTPLGSEGAIWQGVLQTYPWIAGRWPDGSLGPGLDTGNSPLTASNDEYGQQDIDNYVYNAKLSFEYQLPWLIEGLELSGYANFNYRKVDTKTFADIWHVYNFDPETGEYIQSNGHARSARVFGSTVYGRQLNEQVDFYDSNLYHLQLNYKTSIGEHNISAFAAYEQSESSYDYLSGYRRDLPSDTKIHLWAGSEAEKDNYGSAELGGRVNYFGTVGYNYSDRYMVDFSMRYDGSFNFPKGNRFGFFPAVSAGWNLANEPFMDDADSWLNNLKFRASWGKMGNDLIPAYQFVTQYEYGGDGNYYAFGMDPRAYSGVVATNTANSNITWETSYKTNAGIDLGAWQGLLDLSLDVFYEKRRDILISRNASVPDYAAISLPDENLGKVDNRGIELTLNHQNLINDINYNFGGNLTYHKSKVIYMDEADNIAEYQQQEGHPIQSWLVYKADGLYQTQSEIDNSPHLPGAQPGDIRYVDVNEDGEITGDDRIRRYTSPIPKIQYGFNAGLDYKSFGLDVFFQGQAMAEQLAYDGELAPVTNTYFENRWTPENREASLPRAFDRDDIINTRPSTFWLYNASYLRLKNVQISYMLPSKIISSAGISRFRVYISGRNLITWDKMLGNWDPERTEGGGYNYPQIKTFLIGANITF